MRLFIPAIAAAATLISVSPVFANDDPLRLILLAQEFHSVCIKTDSELSAVSAAADRRQWHRRPEELSTFDGARADAAWDADLDSVKLLGPRSAPDLKIAVTVREGADQRECAFVIDDDDFESLKVAIEAVGLNLVGEQNWNLPDRKSQSATFCLADKILSNGVHEVIAERKKIAGWPSDFAIRLAFHRLLKVPAIGPGAAIGVDDSCPIVFTIYDFWNYLPEAPSIEPWLGQKSEAPPKLDDDSQ